MPTATNMGDGRLTGSRIAWGQDVFEWDVEPSRDPWSVMDDWCRRQSEKLNAAMGPHILKGCDLNDREFRRLLGQGQAFGRMRSFIHGSRNAIATEADVSETLAKIAALPARDGEQQ